LGNESPFSTSSLKINVARNSSTGMGSEIKACEGDFNDKKKTKNSTIVTHTAFDNIKCLSLDRWKRIEASSAITGQDLIVNTTGSKTNP